MPGGRAAYWPLFDVPLRARGPQSHAPFARSIRFLKKVNFRFIHIFEQLKILMICILQKINVDYYSLLNSLSCYLRLKMDASHKFLSHIQELLCNKCKCVIVNYF